MATLSKDGRRNSWRIIFSAPDRLRRTIYLGPVQKKFAEQVRGRVEILAERLWTKAALTPELAEWVTTIDPKLRTKLETVGLVELRPEASAIRIERFLADHIDSRRSDFKPATIVHLEQVAGRLVRFYGAEHDMRSIDAEAAQRFRKWLKTEGLSDTSIARRLQTCRMFFNRAVELGIVQANPFASCKQRTGNPLERRDYVPVSTVLAIIDNITDPYWRLLLALSRFGGLRVPSEALSLKWEHINWETSTITVPSPKTEHHAGQGSRLFPLLQSIRPYLEIVYTTSDRGEYVFPPKIRDRALSSTSWANCNLRTQLERIILRSGFKPWSRLWHSMRASCQTDLVQSHPIPVVCRWLGNSVAVAMRHYVDVSDSDFTKAVAVDPFLGPVYSAQKSALRATETLSNPLQAEPLKVDKGGKIPDISLACIPLHPSKVGGTRLEPDTKSPGNKESVDSERTKERTLEQLSANWSTLSDEARALVEKLSDGLSTKAPPHAVHFGDRVR